MEVRFLSERENQCSSSAISFSEPTVMVSFSSSFHALSPKHIASILVCSDSFSFYLSVPCNITLSHINVTQTFSQTVPSHLHKRGPILLTGYIEESSVHLVCQIAFSVYADQKYNCPSMSDCITPKKTKSKDVQVPHTKWHSKQESTYVEPSVPFPFTFLAAVSE